MHREMCMNIDRAIRCGLEIAVFTRNHHRYLVEAALIAAAEPTRRLTFRAQNRWVSACDAIGTRGPLDLYIVPIGKTGCVEYVADLRDVHVDPKPEQKRTQELLELSLPSTRHEGLWEKSGKGVRTLYVISNCRRLETPFPITELVKVSKHMPLSADYRRAYSLVYARDLGSKGEAHPKNST